MNSKSKVTVRDFCEQTSIHGWNFLAFSNFRSYHVIIWLFTILGAFSGCVLMIYLNVTEFSNATVDFQTETLTQSLDEVYFPSIYISNKNVMRKSIFMDILKDENVNNVTTVHEIIEIWLRKQFWGRPPTTEDKIKADESKFHASTRNFY